jgi:hypothetical protein
MQTTSKTEGRYQARPGNPPYVVDLLTDKTSSTHLEFEHAVNRAYILNRFSTGARI